MADNDKKDKSKKEDDKSKNAAHKVIYLGEDKGYWDLVQEKFSKNFKNLIFDYELKYESGGSEIQTLIPYVRDCRPRIVFIDLSKHTSEMLHVVRVLSRINSVIKPYIIGLVDYKQGMSPIQRAVMAGVTCVHIKSSELDAVCFDAICFAFPDALEDHGFATAKLSDYITAYVPSKVGIVSPDGIRIETSLSLNVGSTYNLHSYWVSKGMLKTPQVQCVSQSSEDLFYNYAYSQEYGYEFVEQINPEGKDQETIDKLNEEREEVIEQCQEAMSNWVNNNQKYSKAKMLKTLVIDKELLFYKHQPLSDEFAFVLRCQPYLVNVKKELMQISPQLIVYHMEDVDNEELEVNEDIAYTYNETRTLQYIIKVIKTMEGFNPFIIIFNSTGHDTEKLQKVLNYKEIMANPEKMTPALVHKMAGLLETKLNASVQEYDVPTVFLEKEHPASYAELELDIELIACSENDVYFNCSTQLPNRAILRVNLSVPMFITVAAAPKSSRQNSDYYAVIHGIGEGGKKELRKFINSVFFREHESKKEAEREAVADLKAKTIQKRKDDHAKKVEDDKRKQEQAENSKAEEKKKAEEMKKQADREAVSKADDDS